jgi:hypothetical protein
MPETVFVAPQIQETVVQEEIVEDLKPAAAKKKVIRKKTDA